MKRSGNAIESMGCSESGANLAGRLGKEIVGAVSSQRMKPPFRPAQDDSKPLLEDPILRSVPFETEQAMIRLPPFPLKNAKF
ncbi:uncharacterized protein LOC110027375 [Phalaenopsis equestris]|uniref:uncharacterized protein LOC110027375 n=1 Tax=Phalaenopsis equestris TaxID=78828 RepID=UPI0009E356F3|nr:uncharacterized protein LOC110027375 [Phalaenopsis equestris]